MKQSSKTRLLKLPKISQLFPNHSILFLASPQNFWTIFLLRLSHCESWCQLASETIRTWAKRSVDNPHAKFWSISFLLHNCECGNFFLLLRDKEMFPRRASFAHAARSESPRRTDYTLGESNGIQFAKINASAGAWDDEWFIGRRTPAAAPPAGRLDARMTHTTSSVFFDGTASARTLDD